MQRHDVYAPQTYPCTPCLAKLIETQTRLWTRRALQVRVVARRRLGIGMLLVLALLSTWVLSARQATTSDATIVEPAYLHGGFPCSLEAGGFPGELCDDFFARL